MRLGRGVKEMRPRSGGGAKLDALLRGVGMSYPLQESKEEGRAAEEDQGAHVVLNAKRMKIVAGLEKFDALPLMEPYTAAASGTRFAAVPSVAPPFSWWKSGRRRP